MSIPTIDLRGGPAPVAGDVREACEDVGFLTIVGHGLDRELIDEVASRSRHFFDRSEDEKERFRAPGREPKLPVYRPLGAERLGGGGGREGARGRGPAPCRGGGAGGGPRA